MKRLKISLHKPSKKEIAEITSKADKISKILKNTKNVEGRIKAAIAGSCTVVLGDHANLLLLESICKKMEKIKLPNLLVKIVPSNINDILKSRLIMKDADFIVMVDGKGAGTVGEVHYAISNEDIASKFHLFIKKSDGSRVWSHKEHYLYFPRFDFWHSEEELVELAARIAEKEIRRLACLDIIKETQDWRHS